MSQLTQRQRQWLIGCYEYHAKVAKKFEHKPQFQSVVMVAQRRMQDYLDQLGEGEGEDF
jgi:hypothetical protein